MKVITLITLYANGEFIKPGTEIEMDDDRATHNIARKFVEAVKDAPKNDEDSKGDEEEDEIEQARRKAGQVLGLPPLDGGIPGLVIPSGNDEGDEGDEGDEEEEGEGEQEQDAPPPPPPVAPVAPKAPTPAPAKKKGK